MIEKNKPMKSRGFRLPEEDWDFIDQVAADESKKDKIFNASDVMRYAVGLLRKERSKKK